MARRAGRLRRKLAEMLRAKGLIVSAEAIWAQRGHINRAYWVELARWGVENVRTTAAFVGGGADCVVTLASYDRVTDCVRHGIVIGPYKGSNWRQVEVWCLWPQKAED